ncbi:RNA polymerase sigma factor (sigma-70 family) [Rhodococcus sp. PvR044]|jgi:RNA polymerase sigma factor (sigma-70 family)|uniref:sigma-70 family RNA polymerase sigma factor n=1 Tax=Rhodococcus TaxID=1827 RepID=UPI000BD2BDBF|nr:MULTISPECIES: sigma-70 family RNA polymerase sigma factor [Rhodococcus]MBP1162988.1 RNA polymerase sigma-70 factor (ECF subfamily) [Rhodococcus sp. PvR099]MCZ4554678.1 sigma-70 family RNA polymerase sigma factor [Rhodococcus maanshanensis]PTR44351.1 RNA polymerase sigma-70 factor (ECF subfamily) [Rhodococcus sp. OK611]SNX89792.1 RNA polymerase sigma-70 factor, ECF subfamily [Rhodococcus sp. OK270]
MDENDSLALRFEDHRTHLLAVGYRMLGSFSDADDAIQETWLRLSRSEAESLTNLGGWLTTVMGRVCLDMLRSRKVRREDSIDDQQLPDPIVSAVEGTDPEHEALLGDSVGLALLVVLDTLTPAERLAFVLHDMFAVPFEEVAAVVGKTTATTRQLASRARRRVQDSTPVPDPDLARQREVVDAFLAASRGGDFDALVAVLDPDVVLRADTGVGILKVVRGAEAVSAQALSFARFAHSSVPALVNGTVGMVNAPDGLLQSVMAVTITNGRIVEIHILADRPRLERLEREAARG